MACLDQQMARRVKARQAAKTPKKWIPLDMDFLPEAIEKYAEDMSSPEPELLAELNKETWQKVLMPRMLSGHLQGRVLASFVQMMRPHRILEVGTYTGYSALCMAMAMPKGAKLHTIDVNDELKDLVNRYVAKAGFSEEIHCHWSDAKQVIQALDEVWDLVFLDADKENYCTYLDLVKPKLRPGAWVIADNVLWSGKVTQALDPKDKETAGLIAYANQVKEDPDFEQVLLPVRDGLLLAQFKGIS